MSGAINSINSSFYLRAEPRALNTELNAIDNRIVANNRQIANLENQIVAHKEVSSITREVIGNNNKLISGYKKQIGGYEKQIGLYENTIDILKEQKASSDRLIGLHKEHKGLLQESRDLTKELLTHQIESRDITKKMLDITKEMLDIAEILLNSKSKSHNKYSDTIDLGETKKNLVNRMEQVIEMKLKHYPSEDHQVLTDIAKRVIDRAFSVINIADPSAHENLFASLEDDMDMFLAKHYSTKEYNDLQVRQFNYYRVTQTIVCDFANLSTKNLTV